MVSADNIVNGGGNWYLYVEISKQAYTIQPGDKLEYDILLPSSNPILKGGVDIDLKTDGLKGKLADLPWARDADIKDQNGIRLHGDGVLDPAKDKWYHRTFDLAAIVGTTSQRWTVAFEGDTRGRYVQLLDNIRVTNDGKTVLTIWEGGKTPEYDLRQRDGYSRYALLATAPKDPTALNDLIVKTTEKAKKQLEMIDAREQFHTELDIATALGEKGHDHEIGEAVAEAKGQEDVAAYERGDAEAYLASLQRARVTLQKARPHMHGATGHLVGHAHIDLQWLWPWSETVEHIIPDTFGQAVKFMDEFPEFTFTQSSPCLYLTTKETYPDLYAKMKKYVAEGRWEPIGGRWCEGDNNMISGESHARHLLYGQRFFQKEFGKICNVGWEPDTFGHCWTMPQILKKGGIDFYYFCRAGKNIPLFWWQGPDGSKVLAFEEPATGGWYNDDVADKHIRELANFLRTTGAFDHLMVYGVGNHGGGPTRENIEAALKMKNIPGYPNVKFSTARNFFEEVMKREDFLTIPTVQTELNPVFEGCYTTHSMIKKLNRDSEVALTEAETFAAFAGGAYPNAVLEDLWRDVLWNHHHDTLPGSFIHLSSLFSQGMYGVVLRKANAIRDGAMNKMMGDIKFSGRGSDVVVFNPLAWSRTEVVEAVIPGTAETATVTMNGQTLPAQVVGHDGKSTRVCFIADDVPGCGYKSFHVALGAGGALEKTVSTAPAMSGPRMQILTEGAHGMSAWVVGPITGTHDLQPSSIETVEQGPVRFTTRTVYKYRSSTITQEAIFIAGSPMVQYETTVDWREIGKNGAGPMLKVAFDTGVTAEGATYEIPFGDIQRPNNGHENVALKWVNIAGPGKNVTVLNDNKHAYDVKDGVIRLTLLRASSDPDPVPDMGVHTIRYATLTSAGALNKGEVSRAAFEFNYPMRVAVTNGSADAAWSGLTSGPNNIIVTAVKRAEDNGDLIVRAYECAGLEAGAVLKFGTPIVFAGETDLLERDISPSSNIIVDGPTVMTQFKPYEIRTFRVRLR